MVRHPREVGTGYFDAVVLAVTRGASATVALAGFTEAEQFHGVICPRALRAEADGGGRPLCLAAPRRPGPSPLPHQAGFSLHPPLLLKSALLVAC